MSDHPTKIGMLRQALREGEVMTPLKAWERFKMNSSTYHRCIWEMFHKEGLAINSKVVTEVNGIRHSVHWLEVPGALAPAQSAAVAG
jgi:hypothetical protein